MKLEPAATLVAASASMGRTAQQWLPHRARRGWREVKRRSAHGRPTVPKHQIKTIEVLAGTELTGADDLAPDPWANRHTGSAQVGGD